MFFPPLDCFRILNGHQGNNFCFGLTALKGQRYFDWCLCLVIQSFRSLYHQARTLCSWKDMSCFALQEFETTLREWTEIQQEKISSCVTSVQAEVLTSLVQSLSILVNW